MKARFTGTRGLFFLFFAFLAGLGAWGGYTAALLFDPRILPGVKVVGFPLGGLPRAQAEAALARYIEPYAQRTVILTYGEKSWATTPAKAGVVVDYRASVERAWAIGREGNIFLRWRKRREIARRGINIPPVFTLISSRWEEFCQTVEAEINLDPVDTRVTVDLKGGLHFSPGRKGRLLDRSGLRGLLEKEFFNIKASRFTLPCREVKPSLSEEEITGWPLDQVLGFYVTKFDPADRQRTNNLRLAAAAIDGVVVRPGEDFSFNRHVGPRAPEKGYLEAPVLQQNRLVLGMGGGVCQVSSTLFNAVLLAGLAVKQRANHSQPSTYVPLGRDATVVYDTVDFVFTNDGERPVVITAAVVGSRLVVAVVGHREERPSIAIEVEIKERIPYPVEVENDPGLAAGAETVIQAGREGYKVQLWRKITWPDQRVVREPIGGVAYYPPVKRIIKRGIGSPRFGLRPFLTPDVSKSNNKTLGSSNDETGGTSLEREETATSSG